MSLETELAKANAADIEEIPGDDFMLAPVPGSREAQAAPDGSEESRRPEDAVPADGAAKAPETTGETKPPEETPKVEAKEPTVTPVKESEPKPDASKAKVLGRFETEDEANAYLSSLERNQGELAMVVKQLHDAVKGLQEKPAEKKEPETPKTPTKDLVAILARAALGDEEVTDEMVIEAMFPHLKGKGLDPEKIVGSINTMLETRQRGMSEEATVRRLEQEFMDANPDIKALGQKAIPHVKLIVNQVAQALDPEAKAGKFADERAYYTRLFTDVATQTRAVFNMAEPKAPVSGGKAPAAKLAARDGTFSEGASGPRGSTAVLEGQDKELAEIFP